MLTKSVIAVLSFCIFYILPLQAQYSEAFSSSSRGTYQAACWYFSSTTLKNAGSGAAPDYQVRTGQLTNMVNPHTFGTPCTFFNTSGETLEFDHYVHTLAGSSHKQLDVVLLDENGNEVDTLLTHIYTATTVETSRIPLNIKGNYTIQWRWIGTGGTGRGWLDNLSVPGTNISDPDNGCDCNSNVFPVEWTHFEAWQQDMKVGFAWGTASELNSDFFEIQHSTDGALFSPVGRIEAAGTSQTYRDYEFETESPAQNGLGFFRLKQVDVDGSYTYSKVLSLQLDSQSALSLDLFPNPAKTEIFIQTQGSPDLLIAVRILDLQGRTLLSGKAGLPGLQRISVKKLPAGLYIVEAHSGSLRTHQSLVIQ